MKTLYLHVGPHKTGTTYIQSLLTQNQAMLENEGVVYPNKFFFLLGHHYLVHSIQNNHFDENFSKDIEYINLLNKDLIISSENFSVLNKNNFETIKSLFPNKNIKIIYYYRHPTKRFISYWQETIKQGSVVPYYEYYFKHASRPYKSVEFNPLLLLYNLSDVFGKENIHIIDYENAFKSMTMMKEFLGILDKKSIIPDIDYIINEMLDLCTIEILRILNYKAKQDNILKNENIRIIFNDLIRNSTIDLSEISTLMQNYKVNISLGNTFLDNYINETMKKDFGENLINQISEISEKKYEIPNDKYLLDIIIMNHIDEIYKEIKKTFTTKEK